MRSYWLWLFFNIIIWPLALLYSYNSIEEEMTFAFFGTAIYFILFFIIPLVEQKLKILLCVLLMNAVIAMITFFPLADRGLNPYLILILTLLIAEGFYRLPLKYNLFIGGMVTATFLTIVLFSSLAILLKTFILIYMLLLLIAMIFYKKTQEYTGDLEIRYGTLLSEYRKIKRRIVTEEEMTRQEERRLIAHEIHDSVGHKLTALVMQLEVFRINASAPEKEQIQKLKELASASLEETRSAVKTLKTKETGGLQGILRLIRKLEMENFMRIHFSVKHGAFSAPLTGEQSFVIYRSVQESLTNIMKHSPIKEANVLFEAPGGSIFRFEIHNPIKENNLYVEGFGLTSMRERLVQFGGNLDVMKTEDQFIVRGYLIIGYGGIE